jgi:DNA-3-methyladenine glycosylase II
MRHASIAAPSPACTRYAVPVAAPYRLDRTVSVLRRLSSNLVDIYTANGRYLRAISGPTGPVVLCVWQDSPASLAVEFGGAESGALAIVRRVLGVERDVADFTARARRISWLSPLVTRMEGTRPPRYPSLWEGLVNAIVFQQISVHAASAIMGRLVTALGDATVRDGVPLVVFPGAERLLGAADTALRTLGLSSGKVDTLRRAADAVSSGAITERILEERTSDEAAEQLRQIKGIGPWTAAVTLLRGLGRLDVFPGGDSGVAASLAQVVERKIDAESVARRLGPQRGMLYFYLLLARLEKRGQIGRVSDVATASTVDD